MKEDRRFRVRRAGEEIDSIVAKYQLREAWSKTQSWYQEANGHRDPPTSEQLEQTSNLREDLYRRRPLEGEPLPILVQPVSISDRPLEGEEIAAAVRKLRSGRAGGPLVMKARHLKSWLREVTREKDTDTDAWDKVVSVMQVLFRDKYIPEEMM